MASCCLALQCSASLRATSMSLRETTELAGHSWCHEVTHRLKKVWLSAAHRPPEFWRQRAAASLSTCTAAKRAAPCRLCREYLVARKLGCLRARHLLHFHSETLFTSTDVVDRLAGNLHTHCSVRRSTSFQCQTRCGCCMRIAS